MSDFYQRIGQAAVGVTGDTVRKLLLYAEVEDGVISADIFYQLSADAVIHFRFAPQVLKDLIYEFWEAGENKVAPRSWATLQFVVDGGRFTADLVYPDQLNAEEDISERRPRVVSQHFPSGTVDYSRPNG